MPSDKAILIVCDGIGDRPISELKGKTPLEAAIKPTLDKLAARGATGLLHVLSPGIPPGSDTGHLALFGYDARDCYTGRGPFEALGAGLDLEPTDVAFRGNFATVKVSGDDSFEVLDRRAGRNLPEGHKLAELITGLKLPNHPDVEVIVEHTVEHRCVVVLRGKNLSSAISDTDPHGHSDSVLAATPLDDSKEAERTAQIVNAFTREVHRILSKSTINATRTKTGHLAANIVLVRGAGVLPVIPPLDAMFGISSACVAGGALYKGVARSVGMEILTVPGATASYDTDVEAKARATAKALETHDYVFLHFKPTDSAAHDKNPTKKIAMVEKFDHMVSTLLELIDMDHTHIAITGDHTTSSTNGNHTGDPVPLLLAGPAVRNDDAKEFSERACAKGGLGHLLGMAMMPLLMSYLDRSPMFGA
ncbi:MAG: 2,3-bisphosphoglycerate-independent phosphoglycerate mutase [Candidatus Hermodarchaeia archaeon]|jgi:2,3-bisphosphoglycerate-independent phosphoglycerate mutase